MVTLPAVKPLLVALVAVLLVGCSSESAKRKAAGNVLFKRGDLEGAAREYRAAIEAQPKDPNAHALYGNVLFEQEKYDEAAREYQSALSYDNKSRAARLGLATVHLRRNRPAESRALFEAMIADEPRDVEAHAALGKLLLAQGELDGAERHLRETLVHAQNDTAALYGLGLVLAKRKDLEQANAIFDRLDRLTPERAYAPYGRAVAAAQAGRSDEALRWLAVALARGIEDLGSVSSDASFAALRGTPRFEELISKARTPPQGKAAPRDEKGSSP